MSNKYKNLNDSDSDDSSPESIDEILKLVKETKNIELNLEYKQSIVLRFRNSLKEKSSTNNSFGFKYAFAFVLFFVAGYLITVKLSSLNIETVENTLANLDEEEMNLIVDDYLLTNKFEDTITDEKLELIDSLYSDNLSETVYEIINEDNQAAFTSNYELNDVENLLTDNDVEILYSQLIEKEIL